jgi:hypothetical protein
MVELYGYPLDVLRDDGEEGMDEDREYCSSSSESELISMILKSSARLTTVRRYFRSVWVEFIDDDEVCFQTLLMKDRRLFSVDADPILSSYRLFYSLCHCL